ncbi:MAG: ATP-dependent helicase HrpB [Actinomycetales bacterium]|nr:ATP-dependent helicase HrpB [Actinomycetales bacterium]
MPSGRTEAVYPTDLPVRACLPDLAAALDAAGSAVLVAPPGSGKTTLVPLALAGILPLTRIHPLTGGPSGPGLAGPGLAGPPGRIVVAEPRRVAARAAARRMAQLLGETVGGRIGLTVRGDRRVSASTVVEVVTTGVLVQRLQRDPELPGVGTVVLDECHERHLDADLALALTVDARSGLRPDLRLLATSATLDAASVAEALGSWADCPAPVVTASGALHPVETVWCPPPRPLPAPHGLRVDPRVLDHVANTTHRALRERSGDLLVFLPGVAEISAVAGRLADLADLDVLRLHGRLPAAEQDAALRPGPRRRVVLASAVAESSLTVPGVRVVVDAGLSREPRQDLGRGLGSLTTVPVSRAGADQRAGRAGREAPGTVYRCWSQADHARLPAAARPEISCADLTGFALALACWGVPDGAGLALLDRPPAAAMEVAGQTLHWLGAVDADGRITARGRALATVGVHPRLARALLDGAELVGTQRAAEVVALLSEDGLAGGEDDLTAVWRALRRTTDRERAARWRTEARRLRAAVPTPQTPQTRRTPGDVPPDDLAAATVIGLAFPERVARARGAGSSTYLMAQGTAADLAPGSPLAGTEWLAIAVADRSPGQASARIRLAEALDRGTAIRAAEGLLSTEDEIVWRDGEVVARRVERLGAVVLAENRLVDPAPGRVAAALGEGLRRDGLRLLTWTDAATALRRRLAFCHAVRPERWPDVDEQALLECLDSWLGPDLRRVHSRAGLAGLDVTAALRRLLPWPEAARLDELAPERVRVPSGSMIRIDYADAEAPVLAVKLQELFGWSTAPRVGATGPDRHDGDGHDASNQPAGVQLVVHLLSPAGRPVAVTRDLASFWRTGYPQVRAELRGRYPRHPWPEDPTTATATRRTARRGGQRT